MKKQPKINSFLWCYERYRKFIVMKFLDKQFLVSPEELIAAIQNASNDGGL